MSAPAILFSWFNPVQILLVQVLLVSPETPPVACHAMTPMLNLCEGHVFVELNYPHIIGISGYEWHHDVAT
jgi:hypothetical protein